MKERLTLETERRQQVESIEWRKLTGSGYEDLIIESDSGGGVEDRFGSDLHIFDLTLGRFEDLLEVPSRRHVTGTADIWTQTLDAARTSESHGETFCFVKTVYAAEHRWFPVPQVSPVCYPARRLAK